MKGAISEKLSFLYQFDVHFNQFTNPEVGNSTLLRNVPTFNYYKYRPPKEDQQFIKNRRENPEKFCNISYLVFGALGTIDS
jgi:hypothetical protein